MLAILLSWAVISFILLSLGDLLISLYSNLCKKDEQYNLVDTLLIGICFALIPLSILSLWLPSNQYTLLIFATISITYWIIYKERRTHIIKRIYNRLKALSTIQLLSLLTFIAAIICFSLWSQPQNVDPAFYHYQSIRWNEEFSIVPGLGNLEHRFGFNSNYLLLSAIFTFRFLFDSPVYMLQSTVAIFILCWIYSEISRSQFEIKRIALLIFFSLLCFYCMKDLGDTSTDIIPNLCTFYLAARFLLYPDSLKKSYLLTIVAPILLITFKISTFPFTLLSLIILITLIKNKDFRPLIFCLTASAFIILPWLIRNVIISGYLVFPINEIDLFNFDWKVPREIALMERDYISHMANWKFNKLFNYSEAFKTTTAMTQSVGYILIAISLIIAAISPLATAYSFTKRKHLNKNIYIIYLILIINLAYWFMTAPDIRFAYGALFSVVYFLVMLYLPDFKSRFGLKLKQSGFIILPLLLLGSSLIWVNNYRERLADEGLKTTKLLSRILYRPYSIEDKMRANDIKTDFSIYQLNNNVTIYISNGTYGMCFDKLPCTCNVTEEWKFQDIKGVEARGTTLQDGFRPKGTISDDFIKTKKKEYEALFKN